MWRSDETRGMITTFVLVADRQHLLSNHLRLSDPKEMPPDSAEIVNFNPNQVTSYICVLLLGSGRRGAQLGFIIITSWSRSETAG